MCVCIYIYIYIYMYICSYMHVSCLQIFAEVSRTPVTLWKSQARAAVARMAGLGKGEVLGWRM